MRGASGWQIQFVHEGEILVINEGEVIEESKRRVADIAARAGIELPARFNIVDRLQDIKFVQSEILVI